MMIVMKFFAGLLFAVSSYGAQLADVHTVYVLPMRGGLDQYIAGKLAAEHVVRVVTDPNLADAVVTDHVGKGFEQELAALLTPPTPVKAGDTPKPMISSFGRGRGTVFLVDVKSHEVLWSLYQKSRGTSPAELEKSARRVTQKLQDDRQ